MYHLERVSRVWRANRPALPRTPRILAACDSCLQDSTSVHSWRSMQQ
jgi:hypothetical protein